MIEITDNKPLLQVFICTRAKDKGESCGPKGSAELRETLKQWVKEQQLTPDVKITASLCLGHCENGITACLQPSNQWFIKINAQSDLELLKNQILKTYRNIKAQS